MAGNLENECRACLGFYLFYLRLLCSSSHKIRQDDWSTKVKNLFCRGGKEQQPGAEGFCVDASSHRLRLLSARTCLSVWAAPGTCVHSLPLMYLSLLDLIFGITGILLPLKNKCFPCYPNISYFQNILCRWTHILLVLNLQNTAKMSSRCTPDSVVLRSVWDPRTNSGLMLTQNIITRWLWFFIVWSLPIHFEWAFEVAGFMIAEHLMPVDMWMKCLTRG